jgi:hypothetical protein
MSEELILGFILGWGFGFGMCWLMLNVKKDGEK